MRNALLRNNPVNGKSITEQTCFHQHTFVLIIAQDIVNLVCGLKTHHTAIAVHLAVTILSTDKINVTARFLLPFCKLFRTPALERTFAKRSMARGQHLPRSSVNEHRILRVLRQFCIQEIFFDKELVLVIEHVCLIARSMVNHETDGQEASYARDNLRGGIALHLCRKHESVVKA